MTIETFQRNSTPEAHPALMNGNYPEFKLFHRERGRDLYDFGATFLVVTKDGRFPAQARKKGTIHSRGPTANWISAYWFQKLADVFPNHLITSEVNYYPSLCLDYAQQLAGRSMLVKKTTPLSIRGKVHGYLAGEAWQEYQKTGCVGGISLPAGMVEAQRLPAPLFVLRHSETPAGEEVWPGEHSSDELAEKLKRASLKLYYQAWRKARNQGVLVVETAFEFGLCDEQLLLIGDCLTPRNSTFWALETYRPGVPQAALTEESLLDLLIQKPYLGWSSRQVAFN